MAIINHDAYGVIDTDNFGKGCGTIILVPLIVMFIICVIGGIISYNCGPMPKVKPATNVQSNK